MKVMQCWDDSVTNDIRLVELLRKYRVKATFNFVITKAEGGFANDWVYQDYAVNHLKLSEMKDLYQGFKVAGHGGRHYRQIFYDEFNDEIIAVKQCVTDFLTSRNAAMPTPAAALTTL